MAKSSTVTTRAQPRDSTLAVDLAIAAGLGAFAIAAVVLLDPLVAGGVLLVVAAGYVFRRKIFNWTTMLFVLAAIIMLVPIRRYALPVQVGFELEPYRVIIVVLIVAVAVAAVTRRSFEWKPVLWGWPLAIFLWTMLASIMFNAVNLTETGLVTAGFSNIIQLTFLSSVIFIVRQLLTDERLVMILLNFLVIAGAVIGFFAFVERLTRTNVFLLLGNFLPLTLLRDDAESLRAGGARAYASAQHPIALAVLFCMLIPIIIYLMKFSPWPRHPFSRKLLYTGVLGITLVGMLMAVSRTGIVVLGIMFLFVLILRPKLAGVLFAAGVPLAVLIGVALPQLFQSMVLSLLDVEGTIASQYTSIGYAGQGRLADLDPAFAEVAQNPWAGTGLGSRIVVGDDANAYILDNQVLGILMETGVLGILGLIALFVWPILRMLHFAFTSKAPQSRVFLVFAIALSSIGYTSAMFLYDAFAFMQTFLVLAILYAVAAWAMTHPYETPDAELEGAAAREARAVSR